MTIDDAARAETRRCCALRLLRRWMHGETGPHFTCDGCHRSYVRDGIGWRPVDPAADVRDLAATHPLSVTKGHQT